MTDRFVLETTIPAPIDAVFERSLDVDFHLDSMLHTGEEIVAGTSSGGMVLGDTVTWRAKHFGVWWRMTSEITEYEPPLLFVDEQLTGPFDHFRHEHRFTTLGADSTTMTDVIDYAAPFGPVGVLAERLLLGRHLRALIAFRNEHLLRVFGDEARPG